MSEKDQNLTFKSFHRNDIRTLIAPNDAGRNLDFLDRVENYVHCAGRTAWNEKFGRLLLLLAPNEVDLATKVREKKREFEKLR
jgi:superfamily II DNA/RNA helicase